MPMSFFTNSGNSYGSAVPFQRIVEPAQLGMFLNLEQAELMKVQRYNEAWRFYYGKQWAMKREDGEPLVTINLYRKFIDKSVEFLTGKGFHIQTHEAMEEVTKPFLDEVWEYNNKLQLVTDMATTGAVTGDAFLLITFEEPTELQRRINPFSQGHIRINLLGSEQVYPTWDPINTDRLTAVRIETVYYADRGGQQLDKADRVNHQGRQLHIKRFTQIITAHQIVEQFQGEMPIVRPNPLGEIPIVHVKNFSLPKEFYGLPDGMDLMDLQRELNEKCTDISDTINYHSAPVTVITGAKAKNLERGPKQMWSGLPEKAQVFNLKLEGDMTAANNYKDFIKKSMHEIGDIPEGALGAQQPISNTSGVALHLQYQPLVERTRRKRKTYEPAMALMNYYILRIGMLKGLINLPFDVCKSCGGRIVEVETGQTTKVWDPMAHPSIVEVDEKGNAKQQSMGAYVERPITRKRCYHIDKQTLEFVDPMDMKLKMWRQYGFGGEVREMAMRDIQAEVEGRASYWDYARFQLDELKAWEQEVNNVSQRNQAQQMAAAQQPTMVPGPDGEMTQGPPASPPQEQAPPRPIPKIEKLPLGEVDVPEEPERVRIVTPLLHPATGQIVDQRVVEQFVVPTGCKKPQYLNPFETTVTFNDVLPKDEALQAGLYQQYLQMEIVDPEWVQGKIPDIATEMSNIKKRMKAKRTSGEPSGMATATVPAAPHGPPQTELNPKPVAEQGNMLPGPGGNPVPQGQQSGG